MAFASPCPPSPVTANAPSRQEHAPAALGFAGQRSGGVEKDQVAPAHAKARPGTDARRGDDEPSFLMIPHGRAGGAHQEQRSRPQPTSSAIAG